MEKKEFDFDVLIVGAGPAGTACAYMLSNKGYRIALIDKAAFPRDKICGDALSLDVVNQLQLMDAGLAREFSGFAQKVPSYGVKIISPAGDHLDLPIYKNGEKTCGYICTRHDFDNFMYQQVKNKKDISFFDNTHVSDVTIAEHSVRAEAGPYSFTAKVILGADGAQSLVNKKTVKHAVDKNNYSAGLRRYYENVSGFHPENYIELHFFPELLPGYLWIFPLPNNKANVGVGMLSSTLNKKKINLKHTFSRLLSEHPTLTHRFADARPLEDIKGYGLPLGAKNRKISGTRFLLLGDAASLIDPFSGEGIANAIRSGRVAADIVLKALTENDFSHKSLARYDKELYRRIGTELIVSKRLQRLSHSPLLFNFIVRKASKSIYLKQFINDALANVHKKSIIAGPRFIYHLFCKR